jgi:hypothetical protein
MSSTPISAGTLDEASLFRFIEPHSDALDFSAVFAAFSSMGSGESASALAVDEGTDKGERALTDLASPVSKKSRETANDACEDASTSVDGSASQAVVPPLFASPNDLKLMVVEAECLSSTSNENADRAAPPQSAAWVGSTDTWNAQISVIDGCGVVPGKGYTGERPGDSATPRITLELEQVPRSSVGLFGKEKNEAQSLEKAAQRVGSQSRLPTSSNEPEQGVRTQTEAPTQSCGIEREKPAPVDNKLDAGTRHSNSTAKNWQPFETVSSPFEKKVAGSSTSATTTPARITADGASGTESTISIAPAVAGTPELQQPVQNSHFNSDALTASAAAQKTEHAVQDPGRASSFEVAAAGMPAGIEHWARSSEVQRSVLKIDGKAEMSVHLRAQGSGFVEVRTTVEDRKVDASIVSSGGVLVASSEEIGDLRDRLSGHALTLGTISFQNGTSGGGGAQEGRPHYVASKEERTDLSQEVMVVKQNSGSAEQQLHVGLLNVRV